MDVTNNRKFKSVFVFTIFFIFNFCFITYVYSSSKDEIDFFNVGQGHAILINKVGASAPLLIDAGSTAHPSKIGLRYEWAPEDQNSLASKISNRILKIWENSNGGNSWGGQFYLNVIITHPDEDHKGLVPSILAQLEELPISFSPNFLLGGKASLYPEFLKQYKNRFFSTQCPGIFYSGNLGFLDKSNCITHLFCPQSSEGNSSIDRNKWSIITRVQINGVSALLTGDADYSVKQGMLNCLQNEKEGLKTDILLVPHHGAGNTYHKEWDNLVNPQALIIGAALKHNHPQGNTLLQFLINNGEARIWRDRVMAHGIQYHCESMDHSEIKSSFSKRERLFDEIPNVSVEVQGQQPKKQWHLAWIDLPIYTLWTTGTLYFEGSLSTPKFVDTSHGLMGSIAVSDPKYLLNPYALEFHKTA